MSIKKSILAVLSGLTLVGAAQSAPYTITDLGDLAQTTSFGNAINNNGIAVGTFLGPSNGATIDSFGYIFDNGHFVDLGLLARRIIAQPGVQQVIENPVQAINDSGDIVGYRAEDISSDNSGVFALRGFIYRNDSFQSLGVPDDSNESRALDINESGVISGYAKIAVDLTATPVVYLEKAAIINPDSSTPFTLLGTLIADGSGRSSARAINNNGQVVGWSDLAQDPEDKQIHNHAFWYDPMGDGSLVDLGTLGGKDSFANDINDSGVIVGSSTDSNNVSLAFSFQPGVDTDLVNLGSLNAEIPGSAALDINDSQQIVGYSIFDRARRVGQPRPIHAVLFANGNIIDLNEQIDCPLGWTLVTAKGINNAGQIVGSGEINGQTHAFLLTPDPNGGAAEQCSAITDPEPSDGGGSFDLLLFMLLTGLRLYRFKR